MSGMETVREIQWTAFLNAGHLDVIKVTDEAQQGLITKVVEGLRYEIKVHPADWLKLTEEFISRDLRTKEEAVRDGAWACRIMNLHGVPVQILSDPPMPDPSLPGGESC